MKRKNKVIPFIKERKIKKLKKSLKDLYIKYHNKLNSFGCGSNLAMYISTDLTVIEEKFNKLYTELKVLDPKCPDFKLGKEK